ncbi:MAG: Sec1-like protein [Monoraphidium minutum]|nr:MAG: Sec1-like protein [Monoraphidium minutum]
MADPGMKRAVRDRLLGEMLAGVVDPLGAGWKVLVMDSVTTKVMGSALRMSDLQDAGVSVVEDLDKAREPLAMPAVYFITPSPASVGRLVADFAKAPLYPSVHVFFSSRVTADAVDRIKKCPVLLPLLKTLKEVNLEFFLVDSRTVITDHPKALVRLMGDRCEAARGDAERELDAIAGRLAGLFATLHEYPAIRFKAGRPAEPGDPPGANARATLTQRLAHKVSERLGALQRAGGLPPRETCDLIVVDRGIDPVAPVMHEWTYEAMVHDLLPMEGNVIRYVAEAASGRQEPREHVLDEADETWVELRHAHVADVFTTLAGRFKDFQSKNKAAKYQIAGKGDGSAMTGSSIKGLIAALPQFRETLGRLSVHIWVSSELKAVTNGRDLTALGELEQDLVAGDRGGQDLIKFLAERSGSMDPLDKVRLLAAYLATHPEKMDDAKRAQWQKVARMDPRDMATVCNLAYLGVAVMKAQAPMASSMFGLASKKKKGAYRKREGREESNYALARFDPLLLDLFEDAAAGKLAPDAYPYLRGAAAADAVDEFASNEAVRVASARTNKSAINWARKGSANSAAAGESAGGPGGFGVGPSGLGFGSAASASAGAGRRLVVFVIGGVTRSEMRAAHQASKALGRDVLLASTAVLRPAQFAEQLAALGGGGGGA